MRVSLRRKPSGNRKREREPRRIAPHLRGALARARGEAWWSIRLVSRYLLRSVPYVLIAVVFMLTPVAAVLGYGYVTRAKDLRVRQVQVEGATRLSVEAVLAQAAVENAPNLLALDPEVVEQRLEEDPWIRTARVERKLPDKLVISVTERQPAALLAMGALYLVDARGAVFKRVEPGEHFDFPILTGVRKEDLAGGPDADSERMQTAKRLVSGALRLLDAWRTSPFGRTNRISEVHMDPLFGYRVVLGAGTPEGAGAIVHLGRGAVESKLEKLEAVLADAARRKRAVAEVRLDDERDPNRVAVRFRPGSTEPIQTEEEGEGRGS